MLKWFQILIFLSVIFIMLVIHLIARYLLVRINVATFHVLHCIYHEVLFC